MRARSGIRFSTYSPWNIAPSEGDFGDEDRPFRHNFSAEQGSTCGTIFALSKTGQRWDPKRRRRWVTGGEEMRKQWAAMLSMLGLAGPVVRVQSQVLKGSSQPVTNEKNGATNKSVKTGATAQKTTGNAGKLNVNQQTLRTNQGTGGKQADPLTPSAYCARKQGSANNQLTPPPPGSVGN